jgi:hypothetical protein
MGGGAGIQFEFEVSGAGITLTEHFGPKRGRWRGLRPLASCPAGKSARRTARQKLFKVTLPDIDSFSMHGYMDGLGNVRGNILKVKQILIEPPDKEDIEYLVEQGYKPGDGFSFYFSSNDEKPKLMLFSGYVRGDIHQQFPLHVPCSMTMDVGWGIRLDCTLIVEPTEEFFDLYEAVFHSYQYVPWEEDGEDGVEDYWRAIEMDYCVRRESARGAGRK